jgi:hypothetical protein
MDGLADVAGGLRGPLGQRPAVRVDRNPTVDQRVPALGVPVLAQECAGLARFAPARIVDPVQRDGGEPVVGEVDVDVVDPEVALGLQRVDDDLLAVLSQTAALINTGGNARSLARSVVVTMNASAPSTATSMSCRHSGSRIIGALR